MQRNISVKISAGTPEAKYNFGRGVCLIWPRANNVKPGYKLKQVRQPNAKLSLSRGTPHQNNAKLKKQRLLQLLITCTLLCEVL